MSAFWRYINVTLILFGIFFKAMICAENHNACSRKNNCRDCIQTPTCAWHTTPNYTGYRCIQYFSSQNRTDKSITYPETGGRKISDRPLTTSTDARGENEIVQLRPQRIELKLRANEVHTIKLTYARALGYPVDLYYLMDLSSSMRGDKENLSKLGNSLAKTMRNITTNFRLGFGSFIDKVRMPYTSVSSAYVCLQTNNCMEKYSYRNVMPLSNDTKLFATLVERAVIGENTDAPEGGLDAMMQAIVCRKEIGWREKARRLLVFSTDADFHSAGDGKLAGLIEPNDGKCHLDAQGYYTHAEITDYPSVAAISKKLKENSINVIFAVNKFKVNTYKNLSNHIEGSSCAALSDNSANVVNLVREQYKQISSTIEMRDNATNHVKISYYSACRGNGPEIPTQKCNNLRVGEEVKFTVKISLSSCPTNPRDWQQVIQIYPIGINESLTIDLEMLCGCDCEAQGQSNSEYCNSHGKLVCGICECNENYIGSRCECSNTNLKFGEEKNQQCRENATQIDCSGRGICSCGVCQCDSGNNVGDVISGKYCECDNFSCERYEQKVCSGPEHGKCDCGKCACNPDWTGRACECPVSSESCLAPGDSEICSGKGECICGVCQCETTKQGHYSGRYCEFCPTCSSRCSELKDCVQCQMYQTGKLKEAMNCASNCTMISTTAIDTDIFEKYELVKGEKKCTFYDENDCKFSFIFQEHGNQVRAQRQPACVPKVAIFAIMGSVVGAILGIGLATLLLWKLITSFQDRREYQRFENEQLKTQWNVDNNVLFKLATTTFKNPTYAN